MKISEGASNGLPLMINNPLLLDVLRNETHLSNLETSSLLGDIMKVSLGTVGVLAFSYNTSHCFQFISGRQQAPALITWTLTQSRSSECELGSPQFKF